MRGILSEQPVEERRARPERRDEEDRGRKADVPYGGLAVEVVLDAQPLHERLDQHLLRAPPADEVQRARSAIEPTGERGETGRVEQGGIADGRFAGGSLDQHGNGEE